MTELNEKLSKELEFYVLSLYSIGLPYCGLGDRQSIYTDLYRNMIDNVYNVCEG